MLSYSLSCAVKVLSTLCFVLCECCSPFYFVLFNCCPPFCLVLCKSCPPFCLVLCKCCPLLCLVLCKCCPPFVLCCVNVVLFFVLCCVSVVLPFVLRCVNDELFIGTRPLPILFPISNKPCVAYVDVDLHNNQGYTKENAQQWTHQNNTGHSFLFQW